MAILAAAISAEEVIMLNPDPATSGEPLAVVWIVGANYKATQYIEIAQQF